MRKMHKMPEKTPKRIIIEEMTHMSILNFLHSVFKNIYG